MTSRLLLLVPFSMIACSSEGALDAAGSAKDLPEPEPGSCTENVFRWSGVLMSPGPEGMEEVPYQAAASSLCNADGRIDDILHPQIAQNFADGNAILSTDGAEAAMNRGDMADWGDGELGDALAAQYNNGLENDHFPEAMQYIMDNFQVVNAVVYNSATFNYDGGYSEDADVSYGYRTLCDFDTTTGGVIDTNLQSAYGGWANRRPFGEDLWMEAYTLTVVPDIDQGDLTNTLEIDHRFKLRANFYDTDTDQNSFYLHWLAGETGWATGYDLARADIEWIMGTTSITSLPIALCIAVPVDTADLGTANNADVGDFWNANLNGGLGGNDHRDIETWVIKERSQLGDTGERGNVSAVGRFTTEVCNTATQGLESNNATSC